MRAILMTALVTVAMTGTPGLEARADVAEDVIRCHAPSDNVGARIAACSRAIGSKTLEGSALADVHNNRGVALANVGQHGQAMVDFDAALGLAPDHAAALSNRCRANVHRGQLKAALEDCDRAVQLRPDDATAYVNRGAIFHKMGRYAEAAANYKSAYSLKPRSRTVRAAMRSLGLTP
jgi:Flp pilus assembly protein TadD